MQKEIKKAIFPIAGMGTRFLPLTKATPKELIPLVDKPLIHYTVEEAVNSGIEEIAFITKGHDGVLEYLKEDEDLENLLKQRNKEDELEALNSIKDLYKNLSLTTFKQEEPRGDADAVFKAKDFVANEPCGVFYCDDVIDSQIPGFKQMVDVFKTCQRPVIALKRVPRDQLFHYGVAEVEKIANNFYKIKGIKEKPKSPEEAPSDLALIGRYILTPDVFEYMKDNEYTIKGESYLSPLLGKMAEEGKSIYGYEIKGDWLECGDKLRWFYSFLHLAIKHEKLGPKVREYLRNLKV